MELYTAPKKTIVHLPAKKKSSDLSPWLLKLAYPLAKYIVLPCYFGKIEITGQENIPKQGPVIVAPTHRSRWDALIVPFSTGRYASGRDLRFMVTANEMKGIQGWFIRRCGGFPVDLRHPDISAFRQSVEILSRGEMLTIFPEGGIFRDNKLHKLKPGVARIALQVESANPGINLKILPVSIHYSDLIPHRGTNVYVDIAPPIAIEQYNLENPKSSSKKIIEDLANILGSTYEKRVAQTQQKLSKD